MGAVAFGIGAAPAQASYPGANGKIICSGALATELGTPGPGESRLELFTMNPDGTGETRLTFNTDRDFSPCYSADGTKVAWGRESPNNSPVQVWTMNADGTNQVGPLTSEGSNNQQLRGRLVAGRHADRVPVQPRRELRDLQDERRRLGGGQPHGQRGAGRQP